MLAVFAAVLVLAGAPVYTPILCLGSLPGVYGQTPWGPDGPVGSIELDQRICLGVRFAAANRQERNRLAADHPHAFWAQIVGVGLFVVLHEAEHIALRSPDECVVEKAALQKVPVLLKQFMPLCWDAELDYVRDYHRSLPASYRNC